MLSIFDELRLPLAWRKASISMLSILDELFRPKISGIFFLKLEEKKNPHPYPKGKFQNFKDTNNCLIPASTSMVMNI